MKAVAIVIAFAMFAAVSSTSAQTIAVDIGGVDNCSPGGGNGVFVPLSAGTYIMRPVSRVFIAWNTTGDVTGCDSQGAKCATGFYIVWSVIYPDDSSDSFPDPFGGIWATPELALAHSGSGVLVLASAQTVQFCFFDKDCSDNLGGVSLDVIRCDAEFNRDGTVNSTDVSDFVNAWFTDLANGTLVTDWDGNGVVNSTDVSDYINDWFVDVASACGG